MGPFITDEILERMFGRSAQAVKDQFLLPDGPGKYALKPEFSTQRDVAEYFEARDPGEWGSRIKEGVFDLISDVLLLEESESAGRKFHVRFGVEGTPSFQALEAGTQARLRDLYLDYFFRRQEDFWRQEGLKKLPALKRATNMLVCGEDLGMVPACVPEVMRHLGLLSLEVQRMPKRLGQDFFRPKEAPYLSVITPSTHDMSTIRGWWQEDREVIQRFYNGELGLAGAAPETCEPWLNRLIVQQHLASPAMWSIFQLQDLLGMDEGLRRGKPEEERINVPANPQNYWRYRMHLSLEKLAGATAFNEGLRTLIEQAGR